MSTLRNTWINTVKQLTRDARTNNKGMGLGQYLWNVLAQKFYNEGLNDIDNNIDLYIADLLWSIESEELCKLIDQFENNNAVDN